MLIFLFSRRCSYKVASTPALTFIVFGVFFSILATLFKYFSDLLRCVNTVWTHLAQILTLFPSLQAQDTAPRRAWSSWPAARPRGLRRSLFTSWKSSAVLWSWERPPPGPPTRPRTSASVRPTSSWASPPSTLTLPPDRPGRELASRLTYPSQLRLPSGPPRASSTSTLQARSKQRK